jgi:ribosomal protein S18 acetylase RimI-like enzyme
MSELPNIKIEPVSDDNIKLISDEMKSGWGGEPLIIRGREYFPSKLPGIIALNGDNTLVGFLVYEIKNDSCEIVVFEALEKFQGIGTKLLNELKIIAGGEGCKRIFLMTTNDNLDALRFYQRRGFVIKGIHIDSMKKSREMKAGIPLAGDYNIPMRDEIDLESLLTNEI